MVHQNEFEISINSFILGTFAAISSTEKQCHGRYRRPWQNPG
jgi:hypothetical protein